MITHTNQASLSSLSSDLNRVASSFFDSIAMHFQGGAILSDRNGYVFKSNSIANKIINPLGFKTDFSKFEGSAEMADNIENAALHNETTQFNYNCTIEGIEHTLEINI